MFSDADRTQLANVWKMLITGASYNGKTYNYGVLPIVAHNQTLIGQLQGEVAGLKEIVGQITVAGGTPVDMAKVEAAAKAGAAAAVAALDIPTVEEINDDAARRLAD